MGKLLLASIAILTPACALAQASPGSATSEPRVEAPLAAPQTGASRLAVGNVTEMRDPPRAGRAGPTVHRALLREIHRQVRRHWQAPAGSGSDGLRTTLTVSLTRAGQIADIGKIRTAGAAADERRLADDHQQRAIRAVRLAAPFRLPADYYHAWKVIRLTFDKRLSQ